MGGHGEAVPSGGVEHELSEDVESYPRERSYPGREPDEAPRARGQMGVHGLDAPSQGEQRGAERRGRPLEHVQASEPLGALAAVPQGAVAGSAAWSQELLAQAPGQRAQGLAVVPRVP